MTVLTRMSRRRDRSTTLFTEPTPTKPTKPKLGNNIDVLQILVCALLLVIAAGVGLCIYSALSLGEPPADTQQIGQTTGDDSTDPFIPVPPMSWWTQ